MNKPPRGEAHFRAKLTDAQVKEIRHLNQNAGKGYRVLGQIFGCSQFTIRDICTYRTRMDAR